mmetsp:Transcript_41892/g.115474  ORF Transcript_41892/g.115474 Transcript_41892/m.115474 type:complete len:303 (+) Transcript_41892:244-1152(+)
MLGCVHSTPVACSSSRSTQIAVRIGQEGRGFRRYRPMPLHHDKRDVQVLLVPFFHCREHRFDLGPADGQAVMRDVSTPYTRSCTRGTSSAGGADVDAECEANWWRFPHPNENCSVPFAGVRVPMRQHAETDLSDVHKPQPRALQKHAAWAPRRTSDRRATFLRHAPGCPGDAKRHGGPFVLQAHRNRIFELRERVHGLTQFRDVAVRQETKLATVPLFWRCGGGARWGAPVRHTVPSGKNLLQHGAVIRRLKEKAFVLAPEAERVEHFPRNCPSFGSSIYAARPCGVEASPWANVVMRTPRC